MIIYNIIFVIGLDRLVEFFRVICIIKVKVYFVK